MVAQSGHRRELECVQLLGGDVLPAEEDDVAEHRVHHRLEGALKRGAVPGAEQLVPLLFVCLRNGKRRHLLHACGSARRRVVAYLRHRHEDGVKLLLDVIFQAPEEVAQAILQRASVHL